MIHLVSRPSHHHLWKISEMLIAGKKLCSMLHSRSSNPNVIRRNWGSTGFQKMAELAINPTRRIRDLTNNNHRFTKEGLQSRLIFNWLVAIRKPEPQLSQSNGTDHHHGCRLDFFIPPAAPSPVGVGIGVQSNFHSQSLGSIREQSSIALSKPSLKRSAESPANRSKPFVTFLPSTPKPLPIASTKI